MLRFGLVLLVVTSALAAPSTSELVDVVVVPLSEVGVAQNSGRSNHLTDGLFTILDGGDATVNGLTLDTTINDMAARDSGYAQALALGQAVSTMIARATGVPGDVCIAASLINAYANGNYRQALRNYVNYISRNLELLIRLKNNPESARFATGPQSGCSGGGRIYDFEAAWKVIVGNTTPSIADLINEQYCTAKRLYKALSVKSNNIAAVFTASTLPPVARVHAQVHIFMKNFLRAFHGSGNAAKALIALQEALAQAVQRVLISL